MGGTGTTGTLPVVTSTSQTFSIPTSYSQQRLRTAEGSVTTTNFYTSTSSSITPDHQTVIVQDQASYNIEYNTSDSSFCHFYYFPLPLCKLHVRLRKAHS